VLKCEIQRLIDAYQTGVIELDELTERRARLADECASMELQIDRIRQFEQEQQRQIDLSVTVEAFCRRDTIDLALIAVFADFEFSRCSLLRAPTGSPHHSRSSLYPTVCFRTSSLRPYSSHPTRPCRLPRNASLRLKSAIVLF